MSFEAGLGLRRRRLAGLLAALVLATLAAWPLLATPGLVNTRAGGDSPFLLLRVHELQANLRAGTVPARWMPHAAYGLGYPFFNYYASLPYYLAAALSLTGAGILWAIKLTQLAGFLAAAAAMYALVCDLVDDPWAATLAAAAYTFAPFHMVNVYVRGDSLSEFYAFVFYALIVWAIVRLRRAPTMGHVVLLAVSYGGLLTTHTVSALIFSPLAGLALLWAAITAPRQRLRVLVNGGAALLLGLALGAWYWVPALREQSAASFTDMATGYFHYAGHFRGRDLIQPGLLFDYRLQADRTPFVIGGLQAALIAAASATIVVDWLRRRRPRWADLSLLPLLAYAIWPVTPSSRVLWANVPLLPMAQFPWRFLSIVALATAVAVGVGAARLGRLRWLTVALSLLLALSALARLQPESLPLSAADVTPERLQLYEHLTGNIGSTIRAEYLPAQAVPRPFTSAALIAGTPQAAPVAAAGELVGAQLLARTPTAQTWRVTVSSPQACLAFQTYAFPGWQATVDGRPTPIDPQAASGRIALTVPQGEHQIALRFGRTPLRAAAEGVSLAAAALATALALGTLWRARRRWPRLLLAAGIAACLIGAGALAAALTPHTQAPGLATETMDYARSPYLHPNPDGILYGTGVRLLGYEVASAAAPGDPLRLRLHWEVQEGQAAEAVVRLTTAAEPLFGAPTLATSRRPLAAVTEHELTVPAEVAPGLALLAVEVAGPDGPLRPHTPQGASLGTTYLAPIRVHAPAPAPAADPLARFGQHLDLLQAAVTEPHAGALSVRLVWRPSAPLGMDYVASLKLWDEQGRPVPGAALDTQPRYGLYPTSLWPAGTAVADYYELALPYGTPPGAGYQLEVTLYQAHTLAPLGRTVIPGVTLSRPTIDPQAAVRQAFDCGLALTSWQVERLEVRDGEEIVVRTQWSALSAPLPDVHLRLALCDAQGQQVADAVGPLSPTYPPSRWPQHAVVNARLGLQVPPGTSPGACSLRLEILGPDGRRLGEWPAPDALRIHGAERTTALPPLAHPVGVEFGGLIRLPGYDLERSEGEIALALHWQAIQAPGRDYKVFLHCYDAAGEIAAQRDAMPRGDSYPTSHWAAGEVVSDRMVLDMSAVPPGRYQLAVGWYDPASGDRLEPAGGTAPVSDRRVMLAEVVWP